MPSFEGEVCSFQRLPLSFPRQPVAPSGGEETHRVDLVDAQAE